MGHVMNTKQIVLSAVLVDYLAFTGWACYSAGWAGIVETVASPAGMQMTAELLLFFATAATFIYRDAKARGRAAGAWAGAVMCTGIVSVLLYLVAVTRSETAPQGALSPALS